MSGGLGAIALSWVTSPILSGLIAAASYLALMWTAINRANPRKHALIAVVACSFMTTFTTAYLVMLKSYCTCCARMSVGDSVHDCLHSQVPAFPSTCIPEYLDA